MGKKKTGSAAGNSSGNTSTANPDKPKKPRKPRDPNAPKPVRKSWASKQGERVTKLLKLVGRLAGFFAKGNPPELVTEGGEKLPTAREDISTANAALLRIESRIVALGNAWKPSKLGKAKVGDRIEVRSESATEAVFQILSVDLFKGAEIRGDDGHGWLVTCTDGVVRTVRKKHVQIYTGA